MCCSVAFALAHELQSVQLDRAWPLQYCGWLVEVRGIPQGCRVSVLQIRRHAVTVRIILGLFARLDSELLRYPIASNTSLYSICVLVWLSEQPSTCACIARGAEMKASSDIRPFCLVLARMSLQAMFQVTIKCKTHTYRLPTNPVRGNVVHLLHQQDICRCTAARAPLKRC